MDIKKDLLKVAISNIVVLGASLVNGFVLPTILTLQGYADFRTYTLYAGFIGFLHLGFVDGLNIKYGGKTQNNIDFNEFDNYHSFFIIFQLFISISILIIGILNKEIMIAFVGLAIIPINMQSFFLFFYQAIGEFSEYSKSTVIVPLLTILFTLVLFIIKVGDYRWFVLASIVSYAVSVLFLEINYYKKKKELKLNRIKFIDYSLINPVKLIKYFSYNKLIFVSGFYIMLGTILFNLFFDTGRWLIKILNSSVDFAIYSLAVSLIGFIVIFVSAINKTFYPYLFKNGANENILKLKKILYMVSTLSLPMYFILKRIIEVYISKYASSLPITAVLFLSIPAIFIIKSIYYNLYKVNKKEKQFFIDTVKYLTIGVIIISTFYMLQKTILSVAIASTISMYVWALFPTGYKTQRNEFIKEIIYLVLISLGFGLTYKLNLEWYLSMFLSFFFLFLVNVMFYKQTFLMLIKSFKK